ncbi:MAG: hypothetical protein LBB45_04435 [Methanobrevibacter sp.]|jgi:hypothetical protein|nr:hypothetical protein [Candidatus Methanovirga basalitermitum]
MCEDIIKISTILPTSKMKYEKITQKYLQLKGMEKLINVLNFSGWGRLSDELLTNTLVTKNKSGEIKSVLK